MSTNLHPDIANDMLGNRRGKPESDTKNAPERASTREGAPGDRQDAEAEEKPARAAEQNDAARRAGSSQPD